jgi:hypothetical protein
MKNVILVSVVLAALFLLPAPAMAAQRIGAKLDTTDAAAIAILWPKGEVPDTGMIVPLGEVANYSSDWRDVPGTFSIFDSTGILIYSGTITESLASGETATYAFNTWKPSRGNNFLANLTVTLSGDQNPANDTLSQLFAVVGHFGRPNAPDSIQGLTAGTPNNAIALMDRATSPDGDSVWIRFVHPGATQDTGAWIGPVASGDYVSDSVVYLGPGNYRIRAVAKNREDSVSDSSPVKNISIGPVSIGWDYHIVDYSEDWQFCAAIRPEVNDLLIYSVSDLDSIYAFTDAGFMPSVQEALIGPTEVGGVDPEGSPVLSNDGKFIFLPTSDNKLCSFSTADLTQYKTWADPDTHAHAEFSTVANTSAGKIYATRDDGDVDLFTYDASGNLTLVNTYKTDTLIGYGPVVGSNGDVYVGNDNGVMCFDGNLHGIIHRNSLFGVGTNSALAIDGAGNIWVGDQAGRLEELSDTLAMLFHSDTNVADIDGAPLIGADGTVYAMNDNGFVSAYRDGVQVWSYQLPDMLGDFHGSGCLAPDTTIIYYTDNDDIIALRQDNGAPAWELALPTGQKKARRFQEEQYPSVTLGPLTKRIYIGATGGFYALTVDKDCYAAGLPAAPWPKFQCNLSNSGCEGGATGVVARPGQRLTANGSRPGPTIVRGELMWSATTPTLRARGELLDISGRNVMTLHPGENDVSRLAPGVYFVREEPSAVSGQPPAVRKVIVTK